LETAVVRAERNKRKPRAELLRERAKEGGRVDRLCRKLRIPGAEGGDRSRIRISIKGKKNPKL